MTSKLRSCDLSGALSSPYRLECVQLWVPRRATVGAAKSMYMHRGCRGAGKMWPLHRNWPCPRRDASVVARASVLVQPKCACVQDSRGMFLRNAPVESVDGLYNRIHGAGLGPTPNHSRE